MMQTAAPARIARSRGQAPDPLRVAVLVDLAYDGGSGGHVRFWENCARALATTAGRADLDLTVFYSGAEERQVELARHVRLQMLRPRMSTSRLPFLSHVPDHTDLARWHPRLARALEAADVVHTTDGFFAFARTAARLTRRNGVPLVNSVHTDTLSYTRLYTAETVRRLCGRGALSRLMIDRFGLDRRAERRMERRLLRHQALAEFVFGAREEDRVRARTVLPAERVLPLPRGLDIERFHPRHRNRHWLNARFGLTEEALVVAYGGRVDKGKNVETLANAVRRLAARGLPTHLICVGKGAGREAIERRLGGIARCPGPLDQDELARVFASADIVAHPSTIEIFANVVLEAMACGRPVLAAEGTEAATVVAEEQAGLEVGDSVDAWTDALIALAADPDLRDRMARNARAGVEARFGTWASIVLDRFLPVWREAAGRTRIAAAAE